MSVPRAAARSIDPAYRRAGVSRALLRVACD